MNGSPLSRIALGAALVTVLIAFFVSLTAYQVTSEKTGERILRRAVAATTGLREALPQIEAEVHRLADAAAAEPVTVPFPITVRLPSEEAKGISGDELYSRVLDDSADRLYRNGVSEWKADEDPLASQEIRRVSAPGAFKAAFGLITRSNHRLFLVATIALGALSLLLVAALLVPAHPDVRLLLLGLVLLAAAVPSLAAAVGARFALRTAEPDDPFVNALLDLGVDTTWVAIRSFLALTGLGLVVSAIGGAVLWARSRELAKGGAGAA